MKIKIMGEYKGSIPTIDGKRKLEEIELTTEDLARQLSMEQVCELYQEKCNQVYKPTEPKSEECECKPDKRGQLPRYPDTTCGICGKSISEECKHEWNWEGNWYCMKCGKNNKDIPRPQGEDLPKPEKIEKLESFNNLETRGAVMILRNKLNELIRAVNAISAERKE